MSAGPSGAIVGILPALGGGLTDLRRTGQHDRLLDYDVRHYAAAFEHVYYFSYFTERLEDFTADAELRARVTLLPCRGRWPRLLYAVLLPLLHRGAFRRCTVLRVMQFNGVVPALVARALYGTPFVATYGYHYADVARIAGSRLKPLLYRLLERVAFPRAAGIIVTSSEMYRHLRERVRPPRLQLFPNGVDVDAFASARHEGAGDGAAGAAGPRTVLYVGRLEPEKNLLRLVEALGLIRDLPLRLRVVGDGSQRDALARHAATAGVAVDLVGVVPHRELPAVLARADCFVLPSLTEGHPKALIEAMAAGLPCAASARGGIPTLLTDGETGLLFDPERRDDIARSVRRLLADPELARRLGANARARAIASYDAAALLGAEAAFVRASATGDSLTRMFEDYAQAFPIEDVLPEFLVPRLEALARDGVRAVLDLGAGDGRWLAFFRRSLPPGALIVGCEISHLRARRIKEKGFHVVVAQTEALPFRDATFDLVTLIEVIEHTQSPARSLSEIRRSLRAGGRLALTTPNYPIKRLYDARAALRARSLERLKDDPTHISPLGVRRLARLLLERFESVTLEGAAVLGEGRSAWIRRLKGTPLGTRLSNKLYAVCAKAR